jgi:predicted ATPase
VKALDAPHYLLAARLERERIESFEAYPFCLPAVRHLTRVEFDPAITFLVGENGSGKSTLLEALAAALGFNPEGGSRNFRFDTRATHSALHQYLRLERGPRRMRDGFFLRAESYYNVATEIERLNRLGGSRPLLDSYGGKSPHEQSHGESFLALITERFGGNGLYLLDEPEAALSPNRQLALLVRMHDLVGNASQFIIATHSPILLAYPRATIYSFEPDGIRKVAYEETEHYQVTRRFLTDHERMLKQLLE